MAQVVQSLCYDRGMGGTEDFSFTRDGTERTNRRVERRVYSKAKDAGEAEEAEEAALEQQFGMLLEPRCSLPYQQNGRDRKAERPLEQLNATPSLSCDITLDSTSHRRQ